MRKFPLARSTILSTDFLKPKPSPPKPKFWKDVRQLYRSARKSIELEEIISAKINDDGLCTRCADLDLDAIFAEVMTPVEDYTPFQVEEIVEIGILHPDCRLCTIFAHCAAVEVDKSDPFIFGGESYSLLKCSTGAILKDNASNSDVWIPENLLTVTPEWNFDIEARVGDYYQQGFVVQYGPNFQASESAINEQEQTVDFQQLSNWFNCCKDVHKDCHDSADWDPESPIFMIDCDDRKVGPRMPGTRYAALSYVWGKAALESRSRLELDISITLPSSLPKLIEDAIVATKGLGLKYLWIDRYCIAENDYEVKHKQIGSMDQIYSHAEVTLIAIVNNPEEGLPGVNNTLRPLRPSGQFGKYRFACTMRDPTKVIEESTWNQRAWTYQEAFLSNRKIIFTKEQVLFECRSMFRCEYLDRSIIKPSGLIENTLILPICQRITSYTITRNVSVTTLLYRYCTRNLTFQSDAINAFRGILNLYDNGPLPVKSYWGMPIMPSVNLRPDFIGSTGKEAEDSHLEYVDPEPSLTARFVSALAAPLNKHARRRSNFPSWTWAGWYKQEFRYSGIDRGFTDTKVWIETADRQVRTLDDFAALAGFNLSQSQLSPYVYLEALAAPVRIFDFSTIHIVNSTHI
jgi:hypothetical protein